MTLDPHAILSGTDRRASARLLRLGLATLEPGYRAAIALRNRSFDRGWRHVHRLARPAISVGNLTAGGTGKTPMVLHLCRQLQAIGHRPAVLTRGYAGGDEPAMLVAELGPDVPVAASPDRFTAAGQVMTQRPDTTVFVLDDAFQRRQLHRDLDLVLIDATCPLGLGRVLPRGLLREPPGALARADAVIITRCGQVTPEQLAEVDALVQRHHGQPPLAHAEHTWTAWRADTGEQPLDALQGTPVASAVAIGNPSAFQDMLARHAAAHLTPHVFSDHHRYTAADLVDLFTTARAAGARAVVTTEKDYVKWRPLLRGIDAPLPVYRPVLAMTFRHGGEALGRCVVAALKRSPSAALRG